MENKAIFYARCAQLMTLLHFLWTILLFGGGILVLFYHPYAFYQIGIMTFTILMWLPFRGRCSLTLWEQYFRRKAGLSDGNEKPFMEKNLNSIFHREFQSRNVSTFIALFYIASYAVSILILVRSPYL